MTDIDPILTADDCLPQIIQHSPNPIALLDRELRFLMVSSSYLNENRLQSKTILGKGIFEIFPDAAGRWMDIYQKALGGTVVKSSDEVTLRPGDPAASSAWECRPWHACDGTVGGIILYAEPVSGHRQHDLELRAITQISAALGAAKTHEEMYPIILNQTQELLNPQTLALRIRTDHYRPGRILAARGMWTTLFNQDCPLVEICNALEAQPRKPVIYNDAGETPFFANIAGFEMIKSIACVAIATQGSYIGDLWIGTGQPVSEELIHILTAIGDISANAIHRAMLHAATVRNAEQMAIASQIGRTLGETLSLPEVYARLSHALDALLPDTSTIYISLFDAKASQIRCVYGMQDKITLDPTLMPAQALLPPGKGMQSEVVHTRKPIIVDDLPRRLRGNTSVVLVGEGGPITQSALMTPMLAKGDVIGVIQVQSYTPARFSEADAELLTLVGNTAAVTMQNARLFSELSQAYDATIEGWARALELRDDITEGHTRRTVDASCALAQRMGFSESQLVHIRHGALLHDIGKIAVPDRILQKPGPLTPDEMTEMRRHPQYAYDMLANIDYLKPAIDIPYGHHEKWDGSGYPRGLKGEEIPLSARIFAVIDVWESLCQPRVYRNYAWSDADIFQYLRDQSGKHFDPQVVEAFFQLDFSIFRPRKA